MDGWISVFIIGLKLVSISLSGGIITLAFLSFGYTKFFMTVICVCIIFSCASFVAQFISCVEENKIFCWIDIAFHGGTAIALFTSAVHYLVKIDHAVKQLELYGYHVHRDGQNQAIASASLGFVESLFLLILAGLIWKNWVSRNVKVVG